MALVAAPGAGRRLPDAIGEAGWELVGAIAAEHRLEPLLHVQHGDTAAVPAGLRARWRQAHRRAAMAAMAQRADLADSVRLLRGAGIAPLVLKGGWLAWHAYPAAAQRPLRDIDLLLPADRFEAGWTLLCEAGYSPAWADDLPLRAIMAVDKSPAPLLAPRGTPIELHLHAWLPPGRAGSPSPPLDDAGMFARARPAGEGALRPCAEDMLAHLVIHAVYGHRFDCGPLLLSDIDFLLRSEVIDWQAFWARAHAGGYGAGARLVLALVERYRAPPALAGQVGPGPDALLALAEELLVQGLASRHSAGVAAGGLAQLWPRITRRAGTSNGRAVRRSSAAAGGYLGWAASRLGRTVAELADPAVRRQARQLAQLNRWLSA